MGQGRLENRGYGTWGYIWDSRWPEKPDAWMDVPRSDLPDGFFHQVPELVVDQVYREVLKRARDESGFSAHVSALRNGLTPPQMARIFLDSEEARALSTAHRRRMRWIADSSERAPGSEHYIPLLDTSEIGAEFDLLTEQPRR